MRALLAKVDRTAALITSGLGCLTAAAWTTFGTGAGLAAAGAGLLAIEYLTGEAES